MRNQRSGTTRRGLLRAGALLGIGMLAGRSTLAREAGSRMVARIFFDSYLALALRQALIFAGADGFVASLPQLLHARVNADYDNIVWNTWFSANSEECVVTTPQGNPVVVTVHGGGILGSPGRVERALRADLNRNNTEGLTGQYAAKITAREARGLLRGTLPDGAEFPLHDFQSFRQGIRDLPRRYGIVLDFPSARAAANGYVSFEVLRDDPITICRAGGVDAAAAYLEKARLRNQTVKMRVSHGHDGIDPTEPQCRLLSLGGNRGGEGSEGYEGLRWGYGEDWGIGASGPVDMGRYVAVAPLGPFSDLQSLDFEV